MRIGMIGGTGFCQLKPEVAETQQIDTAWGQATVQLGASNGREIVFLPRHGPDESIPPHQINYRANIDALRQLDCDCIITTNATGSLNPTMHPGDIVLPDQFIDFTKTRAMTFYNRDEQGLRHVDMTQPYCPALRQTAAQIIEAEGSACHFGGTYVATEGPRFETPAEIRMFRAVGGDLVGMTGVPEVILAREAKICYMSLCPVTNPAAGLDDRKLSEDDIRDLLNESTDRLWDYWLKIADAVEADRDCDCRQ